MREWLTAMGHTGMYSLYGMSALLFHKEAGDRYDMPDQLLGCLTRKKADFDKDAVILNDMMMRGGIFQDEDMEDAAAREEERVMDDHMDEA